MTLPGLIHKTSLGIPGHYYVDEGVLAQELDTFWPENWHIVGRASDLSSPGDYLTGQIGQDPVLVVRDAQGQLQARINVCAHRGMRLVEGKGNCSRFQCPYHGWTYDLKGKLKGVPYPSRFPPEIDKQSLGLVPVQADVWGGFVFVRIAPAGRSLLESLGTLPARWEEYPVAWGELSEVLRVDYEEEFNWKFFVENFIDYYHVPFIHPETLKMPNAVGNQASGPHFMTTIQHTPTNYNLFDHIFPNMFFHVSRRQVQFYRILPLAANACRIEIICYQTPTQTTEFPMDNGEHRDIEQILEEDFSICRMLQKQAASRAYRVMYTAEEFEEGVQHFYRTVTESLFRRDERDQ